MKDIILPSGNEKEFIEIAETLGYKELTFIYPLKYFKKQEFKTKIKINFGIIAKPSEVFKAKKLCKFVITKNCSENRKVVENLKPNLVFDYENHSMHDFMHHRNSGLNQVMCKLMKQNKIEYAVCFNSILNSNSDRRVKIFGRLKQNVKLCKKYKVKLDVYSFATKPIEMRNKNDLCCVIKII